MNVGKEDGMTDGGRIGRKKLCRRAGARCRISSLWWGFLELPYLGHKICTLIISWAPAVVCAVGHDSVVQGEGMVKRPFCTDIQKACVMCI